MRYPASSIAVETDRHLAEKVRCIGNKLAAVVLLKGSTCSSINASLDAVCTIVGNQWYLDSFRFDLIQLRAERPKVNYLPQLVIHRNSKLRPRL